MSEGVRSRRMYGAAVQRFAILLALFGGFVYLESEFRTAGLLALFAALAVGLVGLGMGLTGDGVGPE